jgi:hypothetical protein
MVPNAAEVARRRWTVAIVLRCAAMGLLLLATWPLFNWLTEGFADGDLLNMEYYAGPIVLTALLVIVGFMLALLSRPLARLLVPIRPYSACPACNYRLEGLAEPRCPECGLPLSPEFLGEAPPEDAALRTTADALRARATLVTVFRAVGIFLLPFVGLYALSFMFFVLVEGLDDLTGSEVFDAGATLAVLGSFTSLLLFRPDRLARWAAGRPEQSTTCSRPTPPVEIQSAGKIQIAPGIGEPPARVKAH